MKISATMMFKLFDYYLYFCVLAFIYSNIRWNLAAWRMSKYLKDNNLLDSTKLIHFTDELDLLDSYSSPEFNELRRQKNKYRNRFFIVVIPLITGLYWFDEVLMFLGLY